ncbi:MAG: D-tyrosyl-tRNA(Tyr) deacylase [Flavobacteriales bacterium]|jgi:D-aminoacyl-tRNA deacylase|nr:D-tyrosyl-tRNA(Tyr) deacylase [Flavobacteriales bacterium]
MRAVLQLVTEASVTISNKVSGKIKKGYFILLGIENGDSQQDIDWLCGKISKIRLFADENDKMNLSIRDVNGEILVVSQFTLHASIKKGKRPSFIKAAKPEIAIPLYKQFISSIAKEIKLPIQTGEFGAKMDVALINNGPVTIIIDSKNPY